MGNLKPLKTNVRGDYKIMWHEQNIKSFSYWETIGSPNQGNLEDNQLISEQETTNINEFNRGRIAIFIDGSNLFYAALQLGIEINYTKLLRYLTGNSRLLRCFFYTGIDPTNDKQQSFLLWMRRHGYRVVTKELTQLSDGSKKVDLNVEIAVDMMILVKYYDTAVLVSGDGDLAYAVNAVGYQGARVEILSLRSMTSDSLINYADYYLDLSDIKQHIQKLPMR